MAPRSNLKEVHLQLLFHTINYLGGGQIKSRKKEIQKALLQEKVKGPFSNIPVHKNAEKKIQGHFQVKKLRRPFFRKGKLQKAHPLEKKDHLLFFLLATPDHQWSAPKDCGSFWQKGPSNNCILIYFSVYQDEICSVPPVYLHPFLDSILYINNMLFFFSCHVEKKHLYHTPLLMKDSVVYPMSLACQIWREVCVDLWLIKASILLLC